MNTNLELPKHLAERIEQLAKTASRKPPIGRIKLGAILGIVLAATGFSTGSAWLQASHNADRLQTVYDNLMMMARPKVASLDYAIHIPQVKRTLDPWADSERLEQAIERMQGIMLFNERPMDY